MGMFDNIQCNYPLPLPLEVIDLIPDIYEKEIQTKDLENLLDLYFIDESGKLLLDKKTYEWRDDDSAFLKGYMEVVERDIVETNFHGLINFYIYERIYNDETEESGKDISIDFLAKFSSGKLDFIEVLSYEINDATKHIQNSKQFYKKLKEQKNKWYNKYFLDSKPVRFARQKIVRFFYKLHNFTGKLYTFVIRYI